MRPMSAGQTVHAQQRIFLWFRHDLRLRDNAIVHTAAEIVRNRARHEHVTVIPVYFVDPRHFQAAHSSFPASSRPSVSSECMEYEKMGPFPAQFMIESLIDLKKRLRAIGSGVFAAVCFVFQVYSSLFARHIVICSPSRCRCRSLCLHGEA